LGVNLHLLEVHSDSEDEFGFQTNLLGSRQLHSESVLVALLLSLRRTTASLANLLKCMLQDKRHLVFVRCKSLFIYRTHIM
jgi:hypothetical protein